ncbi:MAG: stage sporulation protein [Patescibacteria group bacterium]|nr:stage sporulation protein [Patescibacteria group bacterium]
MRAHHPDYVIALVIAILLAVGAVLMYSISPILSHKLVGNTDRNYYFVNQIKYVVLGIGVWIAASSIPFPVWRKWAPRLLMVSIVSLLALLVPALSHSSHGATRWLDLGPISVQPAEILKISLILYLAVWLEKRQSELRSWMDGVVPFVIMVGAACFVIVVLQRDMGTMMVLALAALGMYFAAGMRWHHMLMVLAGGGVAAWAAIALFPHRLSRLTTFLNPRCDDPQYAMNASLHVCQALLGVGSGGLLGLGLGHSIQVYGYLPEAANDSIFSIIAEEFGMIGSLAVIGLFGFLVYRGLAVARAAPDTFSRLAATGISLWFLFQAIINVGAMLSLVPLTGIPLPFISYGGTSLIISLFGAGILLNISKYTIREVNDASSRERRGDSRPYFPNSGNQRRVKVAR